MRASKNIDEESAVRVLQSIEAGNSLSIALRSVGISVRKFQSLLKNDDLEIVAFKKAIDKAKAKSLERLLSIISDAALDDWKAAAWLLERLNPEHFGPPKQKTEITGKDNGPVEIFLTDEERQKKVLEILNEAAKRTNSTSESDKGGETEN